MPVLLNDLRRQFAEILQAQPQQGLDGALSVIIACAYRAGLEDARREYVQDVQVGAGGTATEATP